jgi:hypothetical protein
MFVLCKDGKKTTSSNYLCKTAEGHLCVWNSEERAEDYARKHKYDNWRVRESTSEDFALVGKTRRMRFRPGKLCYKIIDEEKQVNKKSTSSGTLVELFENYESRKFAISSKAEHEKEFIVEVAQVLASTGTSDWNTRLKEVLPLIVDMCCKYRGYKADTVFERRELVAGDLEMPKSQ